MVDISNNTVVNEVQVLKHLTFNMILQLFFPLSFATFHEDCCLVLNQMRGAETLSGLERLKKREELL